MKTVKIIHETDPVGIGSMIFRGLHRLYYRAPEEVLYFRFTNPLYGDGEENVWDRYLEQPFAAEADFVASEIRRGRAIEEHGVFNRPDHRLIFGYGAAQERNIFVDPERVTTLRAFAQPFLKFRSDLVAKAGNFAARRFAGRRTLSLHKRGTDNFGPRGHARGQGHLVPPEFFKDAARRAMDRQRCEQLFLATDEQVFEKYLKESLGAPVITHATLRAPKGDLRGLHNPRFGRWTRTKHLLGDEAIIDALLMARCDYSLCMRSNLSLLAILLRTDFAYRFIDDHVDYGALG